MVADYARRALRIALGLFLAVAIIALVRRVTDNGWLRILIYAGVLVTVHFSNRIWPFGRRL